MSLKEIKHPSKQDKDTSNDPYSGAVEVDGWLYVSGQGPLIDGEIIGTTVEEQTKVVMNNVKTMLEAGGCSLGDVVKCTCYIADIADFDEFSDTYKAHFSGVKPARTTVEAKLWGGILVEVDAVARIPQK